MVTLLLCLACLLFTSCDYGLGEALYRPDPVNTRADCIYELTAEQAPEVTKSRYQVLVFSDVHFGKKNADRHEQDLLQWLKAKKENGTCPEFCICLGDIADHGTEDEFLAYVDFSKAIEEILGSGRVYGVLGNHDLYNKGWKYYQSYVFPYKSFYHFKSKNFSWYFTDSAGGSMGKNQYTQLVNAFNNDDSPKIVFSHVPIYGDPYTNMGYFTFQNSYEADTILTLYVNSNVKMIVNGHIHKPHKNFFKSCIEFTLPSLTEDNEWLLLTIDEDEASVKEELIRP